MLCELVRRKRSICSSRVTCSARATGTTIKSWMRVGGENFAAALARNDASVYMRRKRQARETVG